jgi:hypothetical protein
MADFELGDYVAVIRQQRTDFSCMTCQVKDIAPKACYIVGRQIVSGHGDVYTVEDWVDKDRLVNLTR